MARPSRTAFGKEVVLMGFSVSGAAAIIFLSTFVAFGLLYTAADNSFHNVVGAQDDRTDRALATANTEIAVTSATLDGDELTITARNTGVTGLSLEETSLLIDNTFERGWEDDATVDGNSETALWLSGESLTINVTVENQPERVKLTTAAGVSAAAEVEP